MQPDGINYGVQWDHIVARANGGPTDARNMQVLCDIENARKQAKPDRYWETGQFFFDIEPNDKALRPGQIEFAWKPAMKLAKAMLQNNADIYRVFLLLWWVVGSGKTISMPILCSAINQTILSKGQRGTPRINKILILAKEAALRDSIANELQTELVKYGIYTRPPEVRIIDAGDRWSQPGYVDRADIVVACHQQLWEINRDEPRTDEQTAAILGRFASVCLDECHFGSGQLARLIRLAPRTLKFGFSNTPINDIGDVLDNFVLLSMLDYEYAKQKDNSLKTLHPFELGVEDGFYVPVKTDMYKIVDRAVESEEQDGLHDDGSSPWVWMNVWKAVIRRLQELDRSGRFEAEKEWFSSHALIRAATVADAETIRKDINKFFEDRRGDFPESDGWRATTIYGAKKGGPLDERKLTHTKHSGIVHPWMRAKTLPNRRCDSSCARILIAVDMVREGINNPLCNVVGWTCPSVSMIELIQRIGRAMRAIPRMNRDILERHQSVHLFWHEVHRDNGPSISRAIEWMLNMDQEAEEMPTLDDLLEDGTVRNKMQKGPVESVLTPDDKSHLEHATGRSILSGEGGGDIERIVDIVVSGPDVLPRPVSGERKKRAKDFIRSIISNPVEKDQRVGVRNKITPVAPVCYERPQETYSDEDLLRFIDTGMIGEDLTESTKTDFKKELPHSSAVREIVTKLKRQHDEIFSLAMPQATQSICGPGSVINQIAAIYARRLKGIVLPENEKSEIGFLVKLVTRAAHVVLGTREIRNGGGFDRIEYHTALRRPKIEQMMFDLVRLELMIRGHLPTVRALYENEVQNRVENGMTLSDFERSIDVVTADECA